MNAAQRDGRACLVCKRDNLPLVPVGFLDGVQVFSCCEVPPRIARRLESIAKPRMGRPRLSEEGASRNLTVRVGPEHEAELERLAQEHGSVSDGVRALIDRSAEARES